MNNYLIINIYGKNIYRFLNKCKNNNINILKIKYISHKEIIIKIYENDYNNILKIKSFYKIKIINNIGKNKLKKIIYNNKVFIISLFIGFIFLLILSNIIFNIEIESNNINLNNKVLKELNIYGIKKYSFKKSYNKTNQIKKEILNNYKDSIEWIEISYIGTKVQIKIVERKINKLNNDNSYTNIVAKKSGIIKRIDAEDGQKIIDINNYVNKGDIIISGTIMKGEEEKEYIHAKGKVYAEIWYNVLVEYPLNYKEKIYTNNYSKTLYIKLNNKYISKNKYKTFERKTIRSLKNNLIPFEVGIEKQQEVKIINDKLTKEEAKTKAIESAHKKVLQSLDNKEYILDEKVLKFTPKDSTILLEIFFSCYEEIGKEERFIPNINKE